MVSSIGVSSGGTVFFSGTASSLDTQSLITNAVNARLLVKKRYTDQISVNTSKVTAFTSLRTTAMSLKTAVDNLAKGTLGTTLNPFSGTQVTATTSDNSTAANILTATTSTGAQTGTYDVVVNKLAKAFSATSNTQTSAINALGYTGSFDIGEDGKTATTITVTATTTLTDIRNQINASSATSGVKADILQQANGEFKLVISGMDTAKAVTVSNVTGDDVLANLGMTDGSNAFVTANVIQQAQQAEFTVNNMLVKSDTNTANNVLTGLSINLKSAAPGTTVTLTVGQNVTGAATQIQTFVNAYNTLQNMIAANKKVGADGTVDKAAYLFGETTNSALGTALSSLITSSFGTGTYNNLRSIGITLDSTNSLVIDSTVLNKALTDDFAGVQALFSGSAASGGSGTKVTGLADQMSDLVKQYSDPATGLIQSEINSLQARDATLQTKADAVQQAADQYETYLIGVYAKMESKIKQADILKQQITAILTGSTPQK